MKRILSWAAVVFLLAGVMLPVLAQRHRDPLTDKEVDDLREAAQDAPKRMKLLTGYAKARMEMLEHLRSDPKLSAGNGEKIRQLLEDIASLVDEVDDNLDMFNTRSEDLRKPLKAVIEMDSDFQLKLRTLKETSSAADLKMYGFALENATDSVNESGDSARAMLQDQIAKRGKAKEGPEKEEKKPKDQPHDDEVKAPCSPC